jgi:uncharacterized protein YcbK (DUF882 family)
MVSRRDFLKMASAAALTAASPSVFAKAVQPKLQPLKGESERILRFQNIHTGEKVSATYWADGIYVPEELAEIDRVLRDHRTREIATMDRNLYDLLYVLQQQVENQGTFQVISGYRSAKTNAMLNKTTNGVARKSLHMRGKAIDIRLPGVELKHLRQAALDLRAGGVGYYPRSNFIHVDTGRPRFW